MPIRPSVAYEDCATTMPDERLATAAEVQTSPSATP